MKKILVCLLLFTLVAGVGRAQSSATQQQIDVIMGKLQDLTDAQTAQAKRLESLERELKDLTDKVNNPPVADNATRDDLRKLAEKVQEIDRKRQEDKELILENIKQLAKVSADTGSTPKHTTTKRDKPDSDTAPAVPEKGYEYVVQKGDTLGIIVKAYREQGVKVTRSQIIAANPKINPDVLIPGKKLFIPDANAK
jgi:LysM repeat protein